MAAEQAQFDGWVALPLQGADCSQEAWGQCSLSKQMFWMKRLGTYIDVSKLIHQTYKIQSYDWNPIRSLLFASKYIMGLWTSLAQKHSDEILYFFVFK